MPNIFKQPSLSDLAAADSEKLAIAQQEDGLAKEPAEVIKFLAIKRTLYRYRPSVVLVYEKENASPYRWEFRGRQGPHALPRA